MTIPNSVWWLALGILISTGAVYLYVQRGKGEQEIRIGEHLYTNAGLLRRTASYLIDSCVFLTIFAACFFGYQDTNSLFFFFMSSVSYCLLWTIFNSTGFSIGKFSMGLTIITEEGRRPGPVCGAVRTAVSIISSLPTGLWIFYILQFNGVLPGFGYLIAVVNSHNRTLHDLIAGTYVIRRQKRVTCHEILISHACSHSQPGSAGALLGRPAVHLGEGVEYGLARRVAQLAVEAALAEEVDERARLRPVARRRIGLAQLALGVAELIVEEAHEVGHAPVGGPIGRVSRYHDSLAVPSIRCPLR